MSSPEMILGGAQETVLLAAAKADRARFDPVIVTGGMGRGPVSRLVGRVRRHVSPSGAGKRSRQDTELLRLFGSTDPLRARAAQGALDRSSSAPVSTALRRDGIRKPADARQQCRPQGNATPWTSVTVVDFPPAQPAQFRRKELRARCRKRQAALRRGPNGEVARASNLRLRSSAKVCQSRAFLWAS